MAVRTRWQVEVVKHLRQRLRDEIIHTALNQRRWTTRRFSDEMGMQWSDAAYFLKNPKGWERVSLDRMCVILLRLGYVVDINVRLALPSTSSQPPANM